MNLEIERRFLVTGAGWQEKAGNPKLFRQGYLSTSPDGFVLRMRICSKGQAWITIKSPVSPLVRKEFEYLVPLTDAEELWNLSSHRLTKKRYELDLDGGSWVVDCFQGDNSPLVLAEVELPSTDHPLLIPQWCSREVTDDLSFCNAALASDPIAEWPDRKRKEFGLEPQR